MIKIVKEKFEKILKSAREIIKKCYLIFEKFASDWENYVVISKRASDILKIWPSLVFKKLLINWKMPNLDLWKWASEKLRKKRAIFKKLTSMVKSSWSWYKKESPEIKKCIILGLSKIVNFDLQKSAPKPKFSLSRITLPYLLSW